MSAIEETRTAATVGNGTGGGIQSPSGGATLPQLPYADAVHRALCAIEVLPDSVETGVRTEIFDGQRELFVRVEWMPGHDDLAPDVLRTAGLTVQWSHLTGWSVCSGDELAELAVDDLADPDTIADRCMHAVLCGLGCACEKPSPGRWERAAALNAALAAYDEREEDGR
ncbi:hypothetical protein [Streptomyces sp. NPDC088847]|uniref:hypothetical protein n=1 Tax=Streptomyces sp. NPDC088847 TaxID=3365909 RepID=UPI00381A00CA